MKNYSRSEVVARLLAGEKPLLVEALPEKHFNDWHLPGAVNIDQDKAAELASELLPDKQREVIVYCASSTCRNADTVARQLVTLGYANVALYKGGKEDWQAAGLPAGIVK